MKDKRQTQGKRSGPLDNDVATHNGKVRCAIYTRKSTDEGVDQEFNSLDAQRESAENYIASMKHEGWECLPGSYDDGGFTGGNMERPAFKRLMADVETGEIDVVVVYKVDRLSRSLLDFTRIMESFEQHNVSFVSVIRVQNLRPLTSTSSWNRQRKMWGELAIYSTELNG